MCMLIPPTKPPRSNNNGRFPSCPDDFRPGLYDIMLALAKDVTQDIQCNVSTCHEKDLRVLDIAHIRNNGKQMPLSKASIKRFYLQNPYDLFHDLEILCCKCNRIQRYVDGDWSRK